MARFLFVFVALIAVISGLTILFWWKFVSDPVNIGNHEKILAVIPNGSSAADAGKILAEKGIIKDPFVFRVAVQLQGNAGRILAGAYKISPDHPLLEVLQILQKGPSDIWVTIPEGFRREQIAVRLGSSLGSEAQSFDQREFLNLTRGLEGRLFPDTYLLPQETAPSTVVAVLQANFTKRTVDVLTPPFPDGLSAQNVITLASIIERETKDSPGERPIVAGILLKRLKNDWPLQTDATLQFVRDSQVVTKGASADYEFWKPITVDDKSLDSPFNTYLNPGLPPAPIANPGLSAIKAVMNPQNSPYWYYLHGSDGIIHFAATLEEQQQNIEKYL